MAEIKFVRCYKMNREDYYDVLYKTNRMYTFYGEYRFIPKTVRAFIESHDSKMQIDKFHGEEYIYS